MSNDFKIATWDNKPVIDYIPATAMDDIEDDLKQMIAYTANKGLKWALQDAFALFDIEDNSLHLGVWGNGGTPLFDTDLGDGFDICSISDNCDFEDYGRMAEIFENFAKGIREYIKEAEEEDE